MASPPNLISSARNAARTALIIFFGILALSLIRALLSLMQGGKSHYEWNVAFRFSLFVGIVSFFPIFAWYLMTGARAQPALDILGKRISLSDRLKPPLWGFLAIEYYWFVLNRTYLVFTAAEGLYGWQAQGPVTAANRSYFVTYRRLLGDEQFMRNRTAIEELSRLPGGFFLSRAEISSIEADDRQEWGMAGIPHTGRIHVRLVSGKSREFIILGTVIPDQIRTKIVSVLGA
jgi:hypothetical protein